MWNWASIMMTTLLTIMSTCITTGLMNISMPKPQTVIRTSVQCNMRRTKPSSMVRKRKRAIKFHRSISSVCLVIMCVARSIMTMHHVCQQDVQGLSSMLILMITGVVRLNTIMCSSRTRLRLMKQTAEAITCSISVWRTQVITVMSAIIGCS